MDNLSLNEKLIQLHGRWGTYLIKKSSIEGLLVKQEAILVFFGSGMYEEVYKEYLQELVHAMEGSR